MDNKKEKISDEKDNICRDSHSDVFLSSEIKVSENVSKEFFAISKMFISPDPKMLPYPKFDD